MERALQRLALLFFGLLCALYAPAFASAQTIVPGGTVYSTNVTWTASGSPYVIAGNLRVAQGATLTIQPGVVVKMGSTFTMVTINGQLVAQGAVDNPIVITSVQDDSADGVDSGGDGASAGAPGQWYSIRIDAAASYASSFDHVDVRYGAYGSADYGYGALNVSAGTATISNSRFHHNQRSGIYVYGSSEAVISKTRLDHNANGASAIGGTVSISNSVIDHNSNTGVYYNFATTPPTQSVTLASRIADNGVRGVWFNVASSVPGSKAPIAHRSNIFRNGAANQNGIYPVQLYVLQSGARTDVDWSNNYWGTWGAGNAVNANPCSAAVPPENPWHLTYGPYSGGGGPAVPPGPVSHKTKLISSVAPGTFCGSDLVTTYPFSRTPYETQYIAIFSPLVELAMARDARPFLRFDADERWTPLLLDPFFTEVSGNEGAHKFCPNPGSTDNCISLTSLQQFRALSEGTPTGHLNINNTDDFFGNAQYKSLYVENGSCSPAWDTLRECGDPAHSALYYNLTTKDGADGYQTARSYWDYWWFYRFNDAHSTEFDHEGDWEGMTVVTPAALDPEIGPTDQILYVVYAQHQGFYRQLPGTYDVDGGSHPVGYPANASHATYPGTCGSVCTNDAGLPEGGHDGARSWSVNGCTSCLAPLPEANFSPLNYPLAADWNALQVRWGSTENGYLNGATSPPAPGQQTRYQAPWNANGSAAPPPAFKSQRSVSTTARTAAMICSQWFGGGVVALLCDTRAATAASRAGIFGGKRKGTYSVRLGQRSARYGSTFGIAQAVGRPLRADAVVKLTGQIPRGVVLKLRVELPKGVATVTFRLPRLAHGTRGRLLRSGTSQRPAFSLSLANGKRILAASVEMAS